MGIGFARGAPDIQTGGPPQQGRQPKLHEPPVGNPTGGFAFPGLNKSIEANRGPIHVHRIPPLRLQPIRLAILRPRRSRHPIESKTQIEAVRGLLPTAPAEDTHQ